MATARTPADRPAPYIYVCERGFVLVGRPRPQLPGDSALFVVLDDVAVMRRWGTTAGLGQVATLGPLPNTILDPEPAGTELAITSIYRRIPCDSKAWGRWPS
jgi:hypothetical protein